MRLNMDKQKLNEEQETQETFEFVLDADFVRKNRKTVKAALETAEVVEGLNQGSDTEQE